MQEINLRDNLGRYYRYPASNKSSFSGFLSQLINIFMTCKLGHFSYINKLIFAHLINLALCYKNVCVGRYSLHWRYNINTGKRIL